MAHIEIELPPSDATAFDNVFWRFCSGELSSEAEPFVHITACDLGSAQRRTIVFLDERHATAFRRQWWGFLDARRMNG
jgi:hypothetical protein